MLEKQAIEELRAAFADERGGIYVGAGASIDGGLPSWSQLLSELLTRLQKMPGHDPRVVRDGKKSLKDPSKYLALASTLRTSLGNEFTAYVSDRFGKMAGQPGKLHHMVMTLPWKLIVTTNYDSLLERAYIARSSTKDLPTSLSYDQPGDIAYNFAQGNRIIIKAHGDAGTNAASVVLSEKDYRRLIHQSVGYLSIMQTIFTTTSFLFVGTSMNDPDFKLILSFLYSAFHGRTPVHVALMPQSQVNTICQKSYYEDYNIRVVGIPDNDRTGAAIAFMTKLRTSLRQIPAAKPSKKKKKKA